MKIRNVRTDWARTASVAAVTIVLTAAVRGPLAAQSQAAATIAAVDTTGGGASAAPLDALVRTAQAIHPAIRAAADRLAAARARVGPAGLRPNPMLMVGVQNLPVTRPGFSDFMTMKMVGIGQTLPYPGKLSLSRQVAERELAAAQVALEAARLDVSREVKDAYYEIAYLDRALEVLRNNRDVLTSFTRVTEARYGVGTGEQQDVLKARVETARLAEEASALTEQRAAAVARLNAALARPADAPVGEAAVPARIARAAVAERAQDVRFASPALGARAAGSPLPPLSAVQEMAVRNSPMLREHEQRIAAQAARVELARKAYLPDFDLSLQYGQRQDRSDMVTAMVTVPLPIQKGRRQDLQVAEARAELSALQAAHGAKQLELRAQVARLYSDLERDRAQLALFKKAILPQGRAALTAALASFQVGRVEFLTLLENQTTLFNYETAYYRLLTDFARTLAELDRTVGKEIL